MSVISVTIPVMNTCCHCCFREHGEQRKNDTSIRYRPIFSGIGHYQYRPIPSPIPGDDTGRNALQKHGVIGMQRQRQSKFIAAAYSSYRRDMTCKYDIQSSPVKLIDIQIGYGPPALRPAWLIQTIDDSSLV